ncbi:hypothetical protein A6U96_09360 [Agrobacterium tumefaciens]|nr:hypothetical protein A6U96_09360 [Agrobacterium tumefaciens]
MVGLLLGTINLIILVKNLLATGEKKLDERLKSVENTLGTHGSNIQTLQEGMKHLPTRENQHSIELELRDMNGRFAALDEKLKPIAATTERLHDLLMEQARK